MQLKQFVGACIIADHGRNLRGSYFRLCQKSVRVESQRYALNDAAQHAPCRGGWPLRLLYFIRISQLIVDVFTVLEHLLIVARDEGIFMGIFARSFGDTDRLEAWERDC